MPKSSNTTRGKARNVADSKYRKANTKQIVLRLFRKNDSDIIEWWESLNNKQQHLRDIIREDIARNKKE